MVVTVELFDAIGKPFVYAVPEKFSGRISIGSLLRVPLGTRRATGMVTSMESHGYNGTIRPIHDVLLPHPVMGEDLLQLAHWLCRYCDISLSTALNAMIPACIRNQKKRKENFWDDDLSPLEKFVYEKGESDEKFPLLQCDKKKIQSLFSQLGDDNFHCTLLQTENPWQRAHIYGMLAVEAWTMNKNVLIICPKIHDVETLLWRINSMLTPENHGQVLRWHSGITAREQPSIWNSLHGKAPCLLVGTAAAIFLPIHSPSLIIVENEHDEAYKMQKAPHFHGRNCAVLRAKINRGLCILGSGSPSMESIWATECGKYSHWKIQKNGTACVVAPRIRVVCLRRVEPAMRLITPFLQKRMEECLHKNKKIVLLFNRLGYAKHIICNHCSAEFSAKNLTSFGKKICPHCHRPALRLRNIGTKRVEEILRNQFPGAHVVRLDGSLKLKCSSMEFFAKECFHILLGTHFILPTIAHPAIGLVGILSLDQNLYPASFRENEKIFQFLHDICGLCWRNECREPIELVLQIKDENNAALQALVCERAESFYSQELSDRKLLKYPPYRRLICQKFFSKEKETLENYAEKFARSIGKYFSFSGVTIRESTETAQRKNIYGRNIYYLAKNPMRVMKKIRIVKENFPLPKELWQTIDVDAQNFD
jgi:primosomal protein N' (replication factor Y)